MAIDDDMDQVALLSTILGQSGFAVETALDGTAGIEAVRRHRPLLVTVDLDMPGMDGVETTRRIREFSNCFVLIVTSKQAEIDLVSSLGAGADGYVAKPLSPRAFRARVEALVKRPRTMASGTSREQLAFERSGPLRPSPATMAPRIPAPAPAPIVQEYLPPVFPVIEPVAYVEPAEPVVIEPVAYVEPVVVEPVVVEPVAVEAVPDTDGSWIENRGLSLQLATGRVEIDAQPIEVSPEELRVLHALLTGARKVHSRAMLARLITQAAEAPSEADRRAADTVMVSLLAKLGESRVRPRWIEAVSGIGYRRVAR